jgi:hypothetical protein
MAELLVKISVQIHSQNGVFYSTSDGRKVTGVSVNGQSSGNYIPVRSGILLYKNQRVKKFIIYASSDLGATWKKQEYAAKSSIRRNLAYAITGNYVNFDGMSAAADPSTLNHQADRDPNRLYVSETYKNRKILGRNAHYVGNSSDDRILTFESNAKEISAGQFGQYPLYVICSTSIWALEVGSGDIAFSKISPVVIGRKIVNRKCVINVHGIIWYLAQDGLHTLPENNVNVLNELQDTSQIRNRTPKFDDNTRIAFLNHVHRQEIWISANNDFERTTYCYSIPYRRWFTISEVRDEYFTIDDQLFGISGGIIYKEIGSTYRQGKFTTAPIHFGEPEVQKRIRSIIMRFEDSYDVFMGTQSVYDVTVLKTRISDVLHSIDFTTELRYAHRQRIPRSTTDLGFHSGYGRNWPRFW